MRLAIFDDHRLGVVSGDQIVDVSGALPRAHDPEPLGAGWWVRMCRDFEGLRGGIERAARDGRRRGLAEVTLRAPVLNPTKIIACAVNYASHSAEMKTVTERTGMQTQSWMGQFDIFLKAPSSVVGPGDDVILPRGPVSEGKEIHHESELTLVIGRGGFEIPEEHALEHVLGYTIGLDMTVRSDGDRSRRKSHETFTPLGPWITTADEIPDPHALRITLAVGGQVRQDVQTGDMTVKIPGIIAYASKVMRLEPGDVILTGAPHGVAQVHDGDVMDAAISGIGSMRNPVRAA